MIEPNKTSTELQDAGYNRVLDKLRFSEWKLCEPLLEEAKVDYEITDNGDPNNMTGGYVDLEIDLWLQRGEIPRAYELLRLIPAWSGGGTLGERFQQK